ncbi:hypothetical protein MX659_03720 [Coriobacteriia bacterium Es71-Z0120]|uniref:multiheme c-type cytochrome n=1 Tax=Parvivirga hydrogeniphila TaxID=2939460 RepID=UPI002260C4B9|nr:hypothetical protein [Parvivirga hydrogeniphila]MCL4078710.1 hypothetical protein [Parvivirga hydrogeniphila]
MARKSLFITAIVAVMVLGFAVSAYAIGPVYITWNAGGANAGTGGPHQDYRLTTEKCAVCHSVHAAAVSNAAAGEFGPDPIGAAETQLLLRSSVADACTYCHITTNVSGLQIYNGVASNYTTDDQYGHNGSTSAECADCHAVHGADTFKGFIAGKILKAQGNLVSNVSGGVQTEAAATLNTLVSGGTVFTAPAASDGDYQVTAFCTRCHKTFSDASETTITAGGYFEEWDGSVTFGSRSYKNHPLKAAEATFVASGANYSGRVAWADAYTCRSCHAAGNNRVSTSYGGPGGLVSWSFPHWTNGNAQFLVSGWGVSDANIGLGTSGANTGKPSGSHTVMDGAEDGVCLRCHTNGSSGPPNNATAGVNVTF